MKDSETLRLNKNFGLLSLDLFFWYLYVDIGRLVPNELKLYQIWQIFKIIFFVIEGDIASYDEDGHVWISDRLKELIKVKGLQVSVFIVSLPSKSQQMKFSNSFQIARRALTRTREKSI